MPAGSIPSPMGGQAEVWYGEDQELERKKELTTEVVNLIKQKNLLVETIKNLLRRQGEVEKEEVEYYQKLKKLREDEHNKFYEQLSKDKETLKFKERELDSRQAKIGSDLESISDIYEYLESWQDELVWETSYNDTRATEIEKTREDAAEMLVTAKNRNDEAGRLILDFNRKVELLSKLEKQLSEKIEAKEKQLNEKLKKLEDREDQLNKLEESIKTQKENLKDKEKDLSNREIAIIDRERSLLHVQTSGV